MVGSKALRLAANGTGRIALVLTMALGGLAANAASAGAQWHFFENGVESYRRQSAEFKDRAAALLKRIDEVPVGGVYCDNADKLAAGRMLAELRAELGDLERDWTAFKGSVNGSTEISGPGSAFAKAGIDPLAPGFWSESNKEILQDPQKALNEKLELYRKTRVVDCSDPKARRNPPPVDPPKKDPLAGLKRPARFLQGIPSIPKFFCTQAEYDAWKKAIAQLLRENQDAATALRNYHDEVFDRLAAALRSVPSDTAAVRVLEAEEKWEQAEHARLTRIYYQILDIYGLPIPIIDCTEHLTTPQPRAPKDSVPPARPPTDTTHPHTQERPGTGAPPAIDTTRPHTMEKPGTGTPSGTEPPKVGAIPHGKVGGGGWFVGAGIEENWYQQFAHTAGDQANIGAFTGEQTAPGWGVGLGFAQAGWRIWACRHVNTLHYTQRFSTPGSPFSRVDGDLNGTFYDLSAGRSLSFLWKTHVEVIGGVTYAYDYLDLVPITRLGVSLDQSHRTLETWKTNIGVAIERPLSSDLNWRLNMTYTGAGTSNDADLNLRFGAGLTYRLPIHAGF
ncbi:MAG TPA: hypothetical protein VGQ44_21880 [Gemmatimonadaceae bacterium]|jgi:hypothetical protein|nr:hypothetical protein [Gemmatimonadaceae bacterium]